MFKYIFLVLVLCPWTTHAEELDVLTVDRIISTHISMAFPNEKNIRPKIGDFEITNYVLMSNGIGERWSVITLTNLSSGHRNFEHGHLMALFADGNRKSPLEYKLGFRGKETQSITVSFGEHKFPILSIYTSNDRANH